PEIQAEIDECFAYADALRDRGIDARVVVEVLSSPGSVKTKCKRNTRTFSPTLHPLQRLRPKL
ncbi:hypothetical protein Tco_0141301, partial [Tanacetum coccineum]